MISWKREEEGKNVSMNEILITLGVFAASLVALVVKMTSENDGKGSFSIISHFFVVATFISSFFLLLVYILNGTPQVSHVVAIVTIVSVFVGILTLVRSL